MKHINLQATRAQKTQVNINVGGTTPGRRRREDVGSSCRATTRQAGDGAWRERLAPREKWAGRQQRTFLMCYKGKNPVNRTKYTYLGMKVRERNFQIKENRKTFLLSDVIKVFKRRVYTNGNLEPQLQGPGFHVKHTGKRG